MAKYSLVCTKEHPEDALNCILAVPKTLESELENSPYYKVGEIQGVIEENFKQHKKLPIKCIPITLMGELRERPLDDLIAGYLYLIRYYKSHSEQLFPDIIDISLTATETIASAILMVSSEEHRMINKMTIPANTYMEFELMCANDFYQGKTSPPIKIGDMIVKRKFLDPVKNKKITTDYPDCGDIRDGGLYEVCGFPPYLVLADKNIIALQNLLTL